MIALVVLGLWLLVSVVAGLLIGRGIRDLRSDDLPASRKWERAQSYPHAAHVFDARSAALLGSRIKCHGLERPPTAAGEIPHSAAGGIDRCLGSRARLAGGLMLAP